MLIGRPRISLRSIRATVAKAGSPPFAARVVFARGVSDSGGAAASFANGADRLGGAVRAAAGEDQRLLEAKHVEGISTTKRFAFDLVETAVEVEQGDHRAAAVRPQHAELTAVDLVYAVGNVDLHLAAFGQRLGRVVDHGAFVEAGVGEFGDRHLEHAVVLPDRIDVRFDRAS